MKFLGLCGSQRTASTNRALLDAFARNAPDGMDMEIYTNIGSHPIFSPDYEKTDLPPVIDSFIMQVRAADGLIISCPEYAHGIPGGLKNALDWLVSDTYVPGMPVMMVHASTRSAHCRAHLSEVLKTMSLAIYQGYEFERNFLGKTPQQVAQSLAAPTEKLILANCLGAFRDFIAQGKSDRV